MTYSLGDRREADFEIGDVPLNVKKSKVDHGNILCHVSDRFIEAEEPIGRPEILVIAGGLGFAEPSWRLQEVPVPVR